LHHRTQFSGPKWTTDNTWGTISTSDELTGDFAGALRTRRSAIAAFRPSEKFVARHFGDFVAVARKLAVILNLMWIDGTEFNWSKRGAAASEQNTEIPPNGGKDPRRDDGDGEFARFFAIMRRLTPTAERSPNTRSNFGP
jgi:hypothetical protein